MADALAVTTVRRGLGYAVGRMGELSVIQVVMVLVVALLVFGPARLPELGKQLGKGLRELRKQATSVGADLQRAVDDEPSTPARQTPRAVSPAASTDDDAALLAGVVVTEPAGADAPSPQTSASHTEFATDDLLDGVVVSGDTPSGAASSDS